MAEYPASASAYVPPARMKPGHWVLLVLGVLLALTGSGLAAAGAALLAGNAAQGDNAYITAPRERYESTGYALLSGPVLFESGPTSAVPAGELAGVQVRARPVIPGQEVFVGIGDADAVDDYLQGVPTTPFSRADRPQPGPYWNDPWSEDDDVVTEGSRVPAPPGEQDFWVVSGSGAGQQELTWDLEPGDWSLVVMNADGSRPVWMDVQVGGRSDLLGPLGSGLLTGGLIALVIGLPLLLFGTAGLGRDVDPARAAPSGGGPDASGWPYPARLAGYLDARLSRGLWLVKWLLAIPHYFILALLWVGLAVTSVAAGVAILFTGRYPRPWFWYSVGVLRWSWRVGFYGYSALGTDRYPPFTLAAADYPASFDVVRPERLSRGLVLVKWWLLAIPHLLVIGIFTGGTGFGWRNGWDGGEDAWEGRGGGPGGWSGGWGWSLLGLLVLIAAVILLFTGRYRHELSNLIIGINRWIYRVAAYVLLLRDEYPPFRLDQGPEEPQARPVAAPAPPGSGGVEPPG